MHVEQVKFIVFSDFRHPRGQRQVVGWEFEKRVTRHRNLMVKDAVVAPAQPERLRIRDEMNFVPPRRQLDSKFRSHHARAAESVVSLAREEHSAVLQVSDDGVGVDVKSTRLSEHFGLVMMEEQATLMGALFRVTSIPGRGTTLEVRLGQ